MSKINMMQATHANQVFMITNISEHTRKVKVPQYKAAPKIETERVIKVLFADGITEEAVYAWNEQDEYSVARGIEICVLKHAFGGTKPYNDFLRKEIKKHKKRLATKEAYNEMKEAEAKRQAKAEERKRRREENKKARKRQEKINIQKEAYLQAMKEYDLQKFQSENNVDFATAEIMQGLDHLEEAFANGHA